MAIQCYFKGTDFQYRVLNISYEFCPPNRTLMMDNFEITALDNYQDYTGTTDCAVYYNYGRYVEVTNDHSFPCDSGLVFINPVEFFSYFDEHTAGYAIEPGVFVMTQEQIDIFVNNFDTIGFFFVAFTLVAAFIKGFNTGLNS